MAHRSQFSQLENIFGIRKVVNARATITTDDWRFEEKYAEAENAQNWAERYEIGQRYMDHIRGAIDHWTCLGEQLFHRPVSHVLMLHANRIDRDYLGQILDYLKQKGVSFTGLREAYWDPLYKERPAWVMDTGTGIHQTVPAEK